MKFAPAADIRPEAGDLPSGHRRTRPEENQVDIPVIAIAIIASLLLTRERALIVVPLVWAVALALVAWGPAHNSNVHLNSAGFWLPWFIVLCLSCGIVIGITAWRERRETAPRT
jgi:hypothetical protein